MTAILAIGVATGLGGCPSASSSPTPGNGAATASDTQRLVHIEARFGDADGVFGEASYKERIRQGKPNKQFKVDLENGKPGSRYDVVLDGVNVGTLLLGVDGEGELEFEDAFPDGWTAPAAGARVSVGDAFTVTLLDVERLAKLEAEFEDGLTAEASFSADRIGDTTYRELEIEVEDATPGTYEVTIDGVVVATMEVDDEGEGKVMLGGPDGDPFPDGFTDPGDGSILKIGDLAELKLENA